MRKYLNIFVCLFLLINLNACQNLSYKSISDDKNEIRITKNEKTMEITFDVYEDNKFIQTETFDFGEQETKPKISDNYISSISGWGITNSGNELYVEVTCPKLLVDENVLEWQKMTLTKRCKDLFITMFEIHISNYIEYETDLDEYIESISKQTILDIMTFASIYFDEEKLIYQVIVEAIGEEQLNEEGKMTIEYMIRDHKSMMNYYAALAEQCRIDQLKYVE